MKVGLTSRLDALTTDCKSLQDQWRETQSALQTKERELKDQKEQSNEAILKQETQVREMQTALDAARDTSRRLDQELLALKQQQESVTEKRDQEHQHIRKTLQLEVQKRDTTIESQNASLEKYQNTINDLRDSQRAASQLTQTRQQKLEDALQSAHSELNQIRASLRSCEADRAQQTGTLKECLSQVEQRAATLEAQRSDLQQQLKKVKDKATTATQELDTYKQFNKETLERLGSELKETQDLLDQERKAREVILAEYKSHREDYEVRIKKAQKAVDPTKSQLWSEQKERKTREEESEPSRSKDQNSEHGMKRMEELNDQLKRVKNQLDQSVRDYDIARQESDQHKARAEEHNIQIEQHLDRIQQLESQLSLQGAEIQLQQVEIIRQQEDIARQQREASCQQEALANHANEIKIAEKEQNYWKDKHADLDQRLAKAVSDLTIRTSELKSCQAQLSAAKEAMVQARLGMQHHILTTTQEGLQPRGRPKQLDQKSKIAAKALQTKLMAHTHMIDRLTRAASRPKLDQAAVDKAQTSLKSSQARVAELEDTMSRARSQEAKTQRTRNACLKTVHILLSTLRNQGERTTTILLKARAQQTKAEHETRLKFKMLKSNVQAQLNHMSEAVHQSQESCRQKHLNNLMARKMLAESQDQLARTRPIEASSTIMLAKERQKRQQAFDVVAVLYDKFSALNKLVRASLSIQLLQTLRFFLGA